MYIMKDLDFKCCVLKPYLYISCSHSYNNLEFGHQMAEKTRGSLLGLSFLSMNYIIFMIADGNMGPVLLPVLHPELLVSH